MNEKFGGQLETVSSDPGRANASREFQRVVNPETAIIKGDDGGSQLLSSTLPVTAPNDSGKQAPVDLELTQQGPDYQPKNPLVDLRLPNAASGVVHLGREGLGMSLQSAESSPATPFKGNLEYPDALPDTDLLLAPVTGGVELFAQIRSPKAPEQFALDLNLPKGAALKQAEDGRIDIVRGEDRLAAVLPAIATDAQGRNLDVTMDIKGESIVVGIPHRGQDVAYPILLDPVFDAYFWGSGGGPTRISDWQYASGTGDYQDQNAAYNHFYSCGIPSTCYQTYGAYVYGVNGNQYQHNTWGQYVYTVPGQTTFVSYAQLLALFSTYPSNPPNWFITYTGAYSSSHGSFIYPQGHSWTEQWGDGGVVLWNAADSYQLNPQPGYAALNDVDKIVAGLTTGGGTFNATAWRTFMLGGAVIYLDDPEAPSVSSISHTNMPNPNAWYGGTNPISATTSATASDPGLGVKSASVRADLPGAAPKRIGTQTDGCIGNKSAPCPASKQFTLAYSSADLSEGVNKLSFVGADPLGSEDPSHETSPTSASQWQVKVDNTPPDISATGGLVTGFDWDLHVRATDGDPSSPATQRSGVRSLKMWLDNGLFPIAQSVSDCTAPEGSCSKNMDYAASPDLAEGQHSIKIEAIDQMGGATHTRTVTVPFKVSMNGDVYHASQYTADPAAGGRLITEEWARLGTHTARTDDTESRPAQGPRPAVAQRTVSTRSPVTCNTNGSSSCDELRTLDTLSVNGVVNSTGYSQFRGSKPDDANLDDVSELLRASRSDLGTQTQFGSLSSVLQPWQKPPPRGSLLYSLYEKRTPIPGTAVSLVERSWVQSDTKLLLKTETQNESTGGVETRFWTYQNKRWYVPDLPSDWFSVARPQNPDFEEQVEARGGSAVGSTRDVETGSQFTPYSLGRNLTAIVNGASKRLCLDSGDVVFFDSGPVPGADPDTANDPELTNDPQGPQTYTAANYGLLQPVDNCVPGLELGGVPGVDLISTISTGSYAAAARGAHVQSAQAAAADPNNPDPTHHGTFSVTIGGSTVTAYTVPTESGETSTLVQVGSTLIMLRGTLTLQEANPLLQSLVAL